MTCPVHESIDLPGGRGLLLEPMPEMIRLLREEPVRKVRFPNGVEAWFLSGYEHFRALLNDPRFSNRKEDTPPGPLRATDPETDSTTVTNMPGNFITADGDDHQRFRRMLTKEFMVKRINALRPRIQQIVDEHLDEVARRSGPVDLVPAFTLPVPSMVIAELLGVPYEQRTAFQDAANTLLGLTATAEEMFASWGRLAEILAVVFDARTSDPQEDLISHMLHEQPDLSHEELTTICILLLVAGHETTANFSGLAIAHLLRQPEQLAKFTQHPEKSAQSVDEIMRYLIGLSGAGGLSRRALEDVEIGGQLIRAGEWVVVGMTAANVDPALCPHAEQLDLDRGRVPHLVFGYGPHQCLGQNLARLELEIMLVSLFARFPDIRLAEPIEDLPFREEMIVPGFHALPVTW
ncbi:cytochrome P450 [Kutzneria sp. NPDC052558]|uniref:cytochrome P450 n=1 Tax=Kutzneria sp. NPDC052558 TaxID=3364121 RepID=UPI0037C695EF